MSITFVPPAVEDYIRALLGGGAPLGGRLRAAFEPVYGADLSELCIHRGEDADRVARTFAAEAVTVGADIFFARDAFAPDAPAGLELLAHEIAHAAGQAGARQPRAAGAIVSRPDDPCEADARWLAAALVRGESRAPRAVYELCVRRLRADEQLVVQRHASWEHRLLGDSPPADLNAITLDPTKRAQKLQQLKDFLVMWQDDPDSVTPERIRARFPAIRTVQLSGSKLLVTYGELNTLADYLADPVAMDSLPKDILLPILQSVRQESYYWVSKLLGPRPLPLTGKFKDALIRPITWDFLDLLLETRSADALTANVGPGGTDHYSAVVARNACHFAPYSWYRWERFYLIARDYATQAYFATGAAKDRLTYLAWLTHGYADHFLQDSFAAGHLINKTLVMQWFIEWASGPAVVGKGMPVADWHLVSTMAPGRQPRLSARGLYAGFLDGAKRGVVRDPQTAGEYWQAGRRISVTGVDSTGFRSEVDAHKHYLTFMNNGGVQYSSGVLHDQLNKEGLYVASAARSAPFQIYGDCTMMDGGDGVMIAAETAQLSQTSISELISKGSTGITAAQIFNRFPTRVKGADGAVSSLEQWNDAQKQKAFGLFADPRIAGLRVVRPRVDKISPDSTGGWTWRALPGQKAVDIAVGGDGSVWITAPNPAAGGRNVVKRLQGDAWVQLDGSADRIAVDAAGAAWVVNDAGAIYRWAGGTWQTISTAGTAGKNKSGADVTGASDIGVGSDGSVWITGRADIPSGHPVFRWNGRSWDLVQGAGVAISVAPNGLPWVVADSGGISRRTVGGGSAGQGWAVVEGSASDIALSTGVLPAAWMIGTKPYPTGTGNDINVFNDVNWDLMPGAATRIAVGPDGSPWVVNRQGDILHLVPATESHVVFTTGDAGQVRGTAVAAQGALFPGDKVEINGTTDLSGIIVGNNNARVYSITMDHSSSYYSFMVEVDCQGPKGLLSGSMYLWFLDESGDEYKLWIFLSDRSKHVVRFDSDKPGIKQIRWSDSG